VIPPQIIIPQPLCKLYHGKSDLQPAQNVFFCSAIHRALVKTLIHWPSVFKFAKILPEMTKATEVNLPVFDGHNDTLLDLFLPEHGSGRSFFKKSKKGHIDLPRAREGGLAGGIFAIYLPPPKSSEESDPLFGFTANDNGYSIEMHRPLDAKYARELTDSILDFTDDMERKSGGQIKIIRSYRDLLNCLENNIMGIVLHIEGAEAIDKDLSNLREYYDRGIRSLGLVWSRPNVFGSGVPFRFPHSPDTGPGLTEHGKDLVKECNRLGIMIDLAHINEKGFRDTARLSTAPLVVTHSNVFTLCQSTRNLTNDQIDTVGDSGGVIGINFIAENINPDGKPDANTTLTRIADHIDYVANRIGIDHVALGSDFDGAEMPDAIKDVTRLPALINTLKNRGYDNESLQKIAFRNWLRVLKDTWKDI
jgi:membrane dipeptidase